MEDKRIEDMIDLGNDLLNEIDDINFQIEELEKKYEKIKQQQNHNHTQ